MSSPNTTHIGRQAESYALDYLREQQLSLVARNWTCRYGELDLIMTDRATLVFIEVRYKRHLGFMSPIESINRAKQQKIIRAATAFIQQQAEWQQHPCRFDVIGVTGAMHNLSYDWIQNAFDASPL